MKILLGSLLSIAALFTGCSLNQTKSSFEHLSLTAKPVREVLRIGDMIEVVYVLSNTGPSPVRGCVTFGAGFDLWVSGAVRQNFENVDHPTCQRKFTLAPTEKLEWSEELIVRDLTPGDATLTGWVKLAIPQSCGEYGCDEFLLRASRERLAVVP